MGALLKSDHAGDVLGGQVADTVLLMGQSQSGGYLNTYVNTFDHLAAEANGGTLYDGYLNVVGSTGRALRQNGTATPAADPELSVPYISVDSEFLLDARGDRELPAGRRVWQVPGTPHTDLLSTVIPANDEIYKSGRLPNLDVLKPDFLAAINIYPLEPTILAATEALVTWAEDGTPAAPSQWLNVTNGALVRDDMGNATGGVRYGLIEHPLGEYLGSAGPGFQAYGVMNLISLENFVATYDTRAHYLDVMRQFDVTQIEAGYLTQEGEEYFAHVANAMMDRIGVPPTSTDDAGIPIVADVPELGDGTGSLTLSIANFGDSVNLGTALNSGDRLRFSGHLPRVTVTDTRSDSKAGNGWSVSGQSSDFAQGTHTLSAAYLGWVPGVTVAKAGLTPGEPVAGMLSQGPGLATPATLGSASGQGRAGSSELGAELRLEVPVDTVPGSYRSTFTVSLFPVD